MELVLLCTTAIIIANFVKKRSVTISVGHTILFVFLLVLSLFKTDIPFIRSVMQNAYGEYAYEVIRKAMGTPYVFFFSTNALISVVELLFMLIAAYIAAIFVIDKILNSKDPLPSKAFQGSNVSVSPVRCLADDKNLYLKYCKLLN